MKFFILFLFLNYAFSISPHIFTRFHEKASHATNRQIHLRAGILHVSDEMVGIAKGEQADSMQATLSTPYGKEGGLSVHLRLPNFHLLQSSSQGEDIRQWLLHLKPPVTDSLKRLIADEIAPYTLGDYIPQNTYIVALPSRLAKSLLKIPSVLFVSEFHPQFKLHETFAADKIKRHAFSLTDPQRSKTFRVRLALESLGSQSHFSHLTADRATISAWLSSSWQEYSQNKGLHPSWSSNLKIKSHNGRLSSVAIDHDPLLSDDEHEERLGHIIHWLSNHPLVHWVEPHRPMQLQNRFARFVIQSDEYDKFDVWDHGVNGTNQIIAIGDTGVDYDHCMFRDPNVPVPVNSVNHNHRKIVTYYTVEDDSGRVIPAGDNEGHGTHTAASVCGQAYYPSDLSKQNYMAEYDGMAPAAKLAIYDYQDASSQDIYLPISIYDEFFSPAYQDPVRSRISSNSWGDEYGQYDIYAEDTDHFAWDFPHIVILFAAGNYGDNGFHSVASPGIAKNCISVGSSLNAASSFTSLGQSAGIEITAPEAYKGVYYTAPAGFGPRFDLLPVQDGLQVVLADPINACTELNNANAVSGQILVVDRGTCTFTVKALRAVASNASMLIVINNEDDPATVNMDTDAPDESVFTVPSVMISRHEGNLLFHHGRASEIRLRLPVPYVSSDQSDARLSEFSSRGPTWDGRLKPDICAPGDWIQSAKSDHNLNTNQCPSDGSGIQKMQGTSMAAPIAAGAVALVRHYCEGGFYKNTPFTPTSSLVKAMLANSGKELNGQVTADSKHHHAKINVTSIPSFFQGYGRIKLDDVLQFNDSVAESDFQLFLFDSNAVDNHDSHSYCFSLEDTANDPTKPLRITLAWIDHHALPSASLMLVNNLDLSVFNLDSGVTYLGNEGGDYQMGIWDDLNNIEQVTVKRPGTSTYLVQILGTHVPQRKAHGQPYSLVVTGPQSMTQLPLAQCANAAGLLCPNNCSGHGTCTQNGRCVCSPNWAGASCSIAMIPLDPKTQTTGQSVPNQWIYYSVDIRPGQSGVKFHIETHGNGDPDFYISSPWSPSSVHDGYPTLLQNDYSNKECDSCGATTHEISIPDSDIEAGQYCLGVYGYCCDPSTYTITVSITTAGLDSSLLSSSETSISETLPIDSNAPTSATSAPTSATSAPTSATSAPTSATSTSATSTPTSAATSASPTSAPTSSASSLPSSDPGSGIGSSTDVQPNAMLRITSTLQDIDANFSQSAAFKNQFIYELSAALEISIDRLRVESVRSGDNTTVVFAILPPPPDKIASETSAIELWDKLQAGLASRQPELSENAPNTTGPWDAPLLKKIDTSTYTTVKVEYCNGQWQEKCPSDIANILHRYWPEIIIAVLGVMCLTVLVVWCLKRKSRTTTTESKRKNQKRRGKFVNLEDFDLAAIEQAVADEELELSQVTQAPDSGSGEDSDGKRKLRELKNREQPQNVTNSDIPRSLILPPNESSTQTPSKERSDSPSTKLEILPSPTSLNGTPSTPTDGSSEKLADQSSLARKKLLGVLDGFGGRREVQKSEDDYEGSNEPSPTSRTGLGTEKR